MVKVVALSLLALTPLAAANTDLGWVDAISRVGVVGVLALALYGLQKRWWVPGWAYRDLLERHERLRKRYDDAVEIALQSSRGVARSATVLEEALGRGIRDNQQGLSREDPR